MIALDGVYNALERLRLGGGFWRDAFTNDKTCHKHILGCKKMDHFRSNAHLRGDSGAGMFSPPVDA